MSEPQKQAAGEQAPYSTKDLAFAGAYAKELSHQLQDPDWNVEESDAALGRYFAERYEALKTDIEKAGVSSKLSDMLKASRLRLGELPRKWRGYIHRLGQ